MLRRKTKAKSKCTPDGFLTVLGGFIAHIQLGCIFLWGNIQPYMSSYFREADPTITTGTTFITLPASVISMTVGLYFGNLALRKYHPRFVYGLGAFIHILSTYFASQTDNFIVFLVLYGGVGGFGIGLAYMAPLFAAWLHFPDRKGLVSGIIMAGFGLGIFIYNMVSSAIANPDNLPTDEQAYTPLCKRITYQYFSSLVWDNLPRMWKVLIFCWSGHAIIGTIFINKPRRRDLKVLQMSLLNQEQDNDQLKQETQSIAFKQALKSKQFLMLFFMNFFSLFYGYFLINAFKIYGQRNSFDDQFLTLVGSLGALFNSGFRFIWAVLIDHFSFKTVYAILLILQFFVTGSMYWVTGDRNGFIIWYCLSQICYGGHFSLSPAVCAQIFGVKIGVNIYTWLFASFALSSLSGAIMVDAVLDKIGYLMFFNLMALFTSLSFALLQMFSTKKFIPNFADIPNTPQFIQQDKQQNTLY